MARKSSRAVAKGKKSDDDDNDDEKKKNHSPAKRKTKAAAAAGRATKKSSKVAAATEDETSEDEQLTWSDEETENRLPFCCAVCHCSEDFKRLVPAHAPWISPGEKMLFHRSCCHGVIGKLDKNWSPPFLKVTAASIPQSESEVDSVEDAEDVKDNKEFKWISKKRMQRLFEKKRGTKDRSKADDDGAAEQATSLLDTRTEFDDVTSHYKKCVQDVSMGYAARRRCVVLDCFAGVGTGLVALKRLQINVAKVIHVEHDKVASHVYKTNHCHAYNSEVTEDGIEHVFLEQFEDLTANVKMFLQEHGPIDLVLGGPPCDDFSIVKANRIDFEEQHDHYLIQLAQFIRELQNLQNPHPLWFFVESTILKQHDVCAVRDAFGVKWGPIEFEAAFLSPIHRKRHYFFNFPLQSIDLQGPAAKSVPACCLENGFNIPAESEDIVVAKAQCFMSAASRNDDVRTFAFKDNERNEHGAYHGRPLKVFERENLMGFPEKYIGDNVIELFETLKFDALSHLALGDAPWKQTLAEKYHIFAGNYHKLPLDNLPTTNRSAYQFEVISPCIIGTQMAPPCPETSTPTFLNAEDYSKNLVGLAYSVPVVEALLKPLQPLFLRKEYNSFDYRYKWDPDHFDVRSDDDTQVHSVAVKAEDAKPAPKKSSVTNVPGNSDDAKAHSVAVKAEDAKSVPKKSSVTSVTRNSDDAKVHSVAVKAEVAKPVPQKSFATSIPENDDDAKVRAVSVKAEDDLGITVEANENSTYI